MEIKTKFSCGDKVWVINIETGKFWRGTVGQVRFEFTDSKGINKGKIDPWLNVEFDNYMPKCERVAAVIISALSISFIFFVGNAHIQSLCLLCLSLLCDTDYSVIQS